MSGTRPQRPDTPRRQLSGQTAVAPPSHRKNPGSRGQRGHTAAAPWRRRRTEEAMEEAPLSVHTEAAVVWTLSVAAAPAWCSPRTLATGRREIIFEFVLVTSPRLAAVSPSAARRPGEQERERSEI